MGHSYYSRHLISADPYAPSLAIERRRNLPLIERRRMDIGTPFSLYFTPPCNFGKSTAVKAGAHRTSVINIGRGELTESYLPKSVRR